MHKINYFKYIAIIIVFGLTGLVGCNDPITEFGFDGQLSGTIKDSNGNPVSGDNKLATFAVDALGENDVTSMVLRIKPDGTYANTQLYPQVYQVKLIGPFLESPTDVVSIDLKGGKAVVKDFQVTPFLTIPAPSISGSPGSTQVVVNYSITPNGDKVPNLREIYVSTVSWPTRTTGTGIGYFSKNTTVTTNQGTATVTGLQPNTKYFIRVGARAGGQTLFNHSEQISFTTPAN